ncbi:MAG: multidrug efflux RND transporter permease subunit [Planctomycetota bacterium]|nr:MAG: multidrug efflux RND transporter permease subunit [Planctomycetota bacterium]
MKFSHTFIDRPILATVLSVVIVLVGALAYFTLPVSQYPPVALPTIQVTASYPGASPEVIAETVATPIEQEINGVENMLYMESQSTTDGLMTLTITFELDTDLDLAQVLVQNRVAIAEPRLPEDVTRGGITTTKRSPDMLLVIHLLSPGNQLDQLYISNYALLRVRDVLSRLEGVGNVAVFGAREYAMRVWLDVERMAHLELTAGDVIAALREQNVQVAAGVLGQQPMDGEHAFQVPVNTLGRLRDASEFADIVVKSGSDGRLVRLDDVARVELAARDYGVTSYLGSRDEVARAVALPIFQRPGSNAVETTRNVLATMRELERDFPEGLAYDVVYNPTEFVEQSIDEVFVTLLEAGLLVVLVVLLFLQGWRQTLIPVIAIPVSLVGTFAVMQMLGISLNNLSLFGLVLAIGIVVDDAIVVVENVQRKIGEGLAPREATRQTMDEVGSALVATSLVLVAVFVPTAFLPGIGGQFFQQFAVTIAVATVLSTFVSLTLSPAMASLLIKAPGGRANVVERMGNAIFGGFTRRFDKLFDGASARYAKTVRFFTRRVGLALVIYALLLLVTGKTFQTVPEGFIPPQDQGYLIVSAQLPDAASLDRTDQVAQQIIEEALQVDGVRNAVGFAGFSGATRTNASNAAAVFLPLDDAAERDARGRSIDVLLGELRQRMGAIEDAFVLVIPPPPVSGIGTAGGFKMQLQDRAGLGPQALEAAANELLAKARQEPGLVGLFSTYRASTPQIFADVDRIKARMLDVPLGNVFEALQVYLGSFYVNDFNLLGRTYRVTAQAEAEFRDDVDDIAQLKVRSNRGAMVPLGSLVDAQLRVGPDRVSRYNLFPAADVNGSTLPGTSTGQALQRMEALAADVLPSGIGYEWTDLAFQERNQSDLARWLFPLAVLFVFLTLAGQYESWLLPLAIILIVPLCLLFGLGGVWLRGMDNNIITQVGLVVLVGLACKNAILIVEFAKAEEDAGRDRFDAIVEACRLRLRPVLMTAFSFILGVIPLVTATGAGFEMRRVLGTAVFVGMLGVTLLGLLLTPVFYVALRGFSARRARSSPPATAGVEEQPDHA